MAAATTTPTCDGRTRLKSGRTLALPVVASPHGTIRKSRTSRWRALSLILLHAVIIGHVIQWWLTGRTLSPVEPSEAMYTLNDGHLNAGFIFFAAALLATLVAGRFVCGWGCHVVAYQDLCAWLMKKMGIKPKPFRSRILMLAPLALALYMFVWPSVYRWFLGHSPPAVSNHLMTTDFWKTFPGLTIAVLTVLVCGFLIVYVLGAKGFCTYGCPYGGFFAVVDPFAAGRILVTDACEHCGHCTATCTSNVRVHEEVALYGMVVDPGCMKCMDCVSVCPNDALYFGFAKPPVGAKPKSPRRPTPYDFALWEEIVMGVIGVGALLAFRGLYGQIPLLMAMGMAAITSYSSVSGLRLIRTANVRLQNLQLKRGGILTRTGMVCALATVVLLVFTGHSAAIQYHTWRGRSLFVALGIGDQVWFPGNEWWDRASPAQRLRLETAVISLERADRWGLASTIPLLNDLVWLQLAQGAVEAAERSVRRLVELTPDRPEVYRGLAGVLRKAGRAEEAETQYRQALRVEPAYTRARVDLAALLLTMGRPEDAISLYRAGLDASPADADVLWELSQLLLRMGRVTEAKTELTRLADARPDSARAFAALGLAEVRSGDVSDGANHLRRALELDPQLPDVRYNLAIALLGPQDPTGTGPGLPALEEAIRHLRQVVRDQPDFAEAHYNLGVATFMAGRADDAVPHIRESIRLAPNDPQAHEFLAVLLNTLGDQEGAQSALHEADRLRHPP